MLITEEGELIIRAMLTIIITTLNEEDHLPSLLDSIKQQNVDDYELIVADAHSTDRTPEIATSYGCRVVAGGSPARGRNEGAKSAQGDLLLFLDADVVLKEDFLKRTLEEFERERIDVGSFCLEPQTETRVIKLLFKLFYNWPVLLCKPILPHATQAILVKRAIHETLGGFNEEIKLCEDNDYARRAKAIGKVDILRSGRVLSSLRRFEKDGWLKTYSKYIGAEFHMILFGSVKSDIFKYRFGHYKKNGE